MIEYGGVGLAVSPAIVKKEWALTRCTEQYYRTFSISPAERPAAELSVFWRTDREIVEPAAKVLPVADDDDDTTDHVSLYRSGTVSSSMTLDSAVNAEPLDELPLTVELTVGL